MIDALASRGRMASGDIKIRVVRATAEIEEIRTAWESLQRHPNADIDYYLLINSLRGSVLRPHVIVLEEGGRTVAMLIGRIERATVECRIGYFTVMRPQLRALTIVYGGVIGEITPERAGRLAEAIYDALRRDEADMARIGGLDSGSALHELARRLPGPLGRDHVSLPKPHWEIHLPPSFEDFMLRFKSKQRSEMRRWGRMLEKESGGQVECRLFREPADIDALCRDAETVARLTYQRGFGVGFFDDEEHRRRLALAAERGWLRGFVLYAAGRPCAFEIGVLYQGTFFLDYTGYDPSLSHFRVGTQVILKTIEHLCESGVARIDCGLGDAAYKQTLGDRQWQERAVVMFAPSARGRLTNAVWTATTLLAQLGAAATRRLQLEDRIKKLWRAGLRRKAGGAATAELN